MRRLLSVFVVAVLVALICGCGDTPKGKKKKRGKSHASTAAVKVDPQVPL